MVLRALAEAAARLDLTGQRVLVAASGGVDSTVLAHGLGRLADALGLEPVLGHVHHGLRGAEADADLEAVRRLAATRGLGFRTARVEPARLREGCTSRARPTLQEAARRVRYEALAKMADEVGAARIATGHTLDDQAETVVMRLLRGSGPDGLAGIPERSPDGRVVRPLLRVSREAIERFARAERLRWREDASNRDPAFARARLRPLLRELGAAQNPRWLNAVADLAEAQQRDAEWIETQVQEEARRRFAEAPGGLAIAREGWDALPEPLARRLAREALRRQGGRRDVSRRHLARMLGFLRGAGPGRTLELPGGLRLRSERDAFWLCRPPPGRPVEPPTRC
jgi:tRNA(Ile)-lysidine synthase